MRDNSLINRFLKDQSGATAIEYGLIAVLVGMACLLAITFMSGSLGTMFNTVSTKSTGALDAAGNSI